MLAAGLILQACSNLDTPDDFMFNQTGRLSWGGSPAADGVGILFETEDEVYGAPGSRDDYSKYFPEDENQILVIADFRVTGETTIRGWGVTYPEIRFLHIKVID